MSCAAVGSLLKSSWIYREQSGCGARATNRWLPWASARQLARSRSEWAATKRSMSPDAVLLMSKEHEAVAEEPASRCDVVLIQGKDPGSHQGSGVGELCGCAPGSSPMRQPATPVSIWSDFR